MVPDEVDELFRLPPGQAKRLARRGLLPHLSLPGGIIRFRRSQIEKMVGEEIESADEQQERMAVHA